MLNVETILNDVIPNLHKELPSEMLPYYRISKWYVRTHQNRPEASATLAITSDLCTTVDEVLDVMRCLPDYRGPVICDIIRREYCEDPLPSAAKIEKAAVSRTTYYAYLKRGEELFNSICYSVVPQYAEDNTCNSNDATAS